MYAWLYLYNNYFPLEFNIRRTSSLFVNRIDLTSGGYRNDQGGQDSNIDLDDDDMSRLQETEATYADRGDEEYDRAFPQAERNYQQEDYERYMEEERPYQEFQWPDRYGWDQYAY